MALKIVNNPSESAPDDSFVKEPLAVSTRAFLTAVSTGETQQVSTYLERQPELAKSRDAAGSSPLMVAILHEQQDIVELLLSLPDIEVSLCEAAAIGDAKRLQERLAEDTTDLAQTTADGSTALGLASFYGRLEVVDLLLDGGAEVTQLSSNLQRTTALHQAVAHRDAQQAWDLARRLLQAGALVDALQAGGFTPLHQAASRGRLEIVELLLEHGADPTIESDQGWTAADLAHQRGHQLT